MVVELQRSLALVATVNATPSFDTTLTVVLFKEILMKKLAWLLGAVALVGLSACDADENNCGAVNCDESAPLCVLAANNKANVDVCLAKDKEPVYNQCGHDKAQDVATMWYDNGACTTRYTGSCESDSQCESDQVCDTVNKQCVAKTGSQKPRLVRIDDLTELNDNDKKNGDDPGADIDTVVLTKASGKAVYVTEVNGFKRGDGKSAQGEDYSIASNPQAVVGAPSSFVDYPTDTKNCYYYKKDTDPNASPVRPFVSLGGKGGYIVVVMGEDIEAGDTLNVLELGGCTLQNTKDKKTQVATGKEAVKVQVSISGKDGDWALVGDSSSRVTEEDYTGIFSVKISDNMLKDAK